MGGARRFTELALELQLVIVLAVAGMVYAALELGESYFPASGPSPLPAVDLRARMDANEAATIADIRALMAAQEAYRTANSGFYEASLDCLADPHSYSCIPSYPRSAPSFLDSALASGQSRHGYNRDFRRGDPPNPVPAVASPTSVHGYRYDATPSMVGFSGVRGFAASGDRICFTPNGTPVPPGPKWGTLPSDCTELP